MLSPITISNVPTIFISFIIESQRQPSCDEEAASGADSEVAGAMLAFLILSSLTKNHTNPMMPRTKHTSSTP